MLQLARLTLLIVVGIAGFVAFLLTIAWLSGEDREVSSRLTLLWMACASLIAVSLLGLRRLSAMTGAAKQREQEETRRAANTAKRLTADVRWFSQAMAFTLFVLILGFGTWLMWEQGKPVMTALLALGLVSFLLFALDMGRQILRPGPMLVVEMRGIEHAMYGMIPWSEVVGLHLDRQQVQGSTIDMLKIGVRRPDRYLVNAPFLQRWTKRAMLRDRPRYGALEIPLRPLDESAELILETACAMRARIAPPALEFWYPAMDSSQIETMLAMEKLNDSLRSTGPETTPAQLETHARAMAELQPQIEASARTAVAQARRANRKAWWLTAAAILFALAWLYTKIFR